jgi:hypothetical protein
LQFEALDELWRSWTPEESEVEGREHQGNANIHGQPFPKSVSQEQEVHTHYNGCHRHRVKHDSYLSAHFSKTSILAWIHQAPRASTSAAIAPAAPTAAMHSVAIGTTLSILLMPQRWLGIEGKPSCR